MTEKFNEALPNFYSSPDINTVMQGFGRKILRKRPLTRPGY